ncbi:MAG: hypothetical protein AAF468_17710 [Pseudomonadota bacterium]
MDQQAERLRAEIATLQSQLEALSEHESGGGQSDAKQGKPYADEATRQKHKAMRTPLHRYVLSLPLRVHLSGPFVYGMIIPIAFLDLCLIVFQATCFRLWKVPRIRRGDYVIVDRHQLDYLNGMEKLNCIYCGYANGVFAFARELAARTEHYWCPIKHAIKTRQPHTHYREFVGFGDAEAWQDHPSRRGPGRACESCLKNSAP